RYTRAPGSSQVVYGSFRGVTNVAAMYTLHGCMPIIGERQAVFIYTRSPQRSITVCEKCGLGVGDLDAKWTPEGKPVPVGLHADSTTRVPRASGCRRPSRSIRRDEA